MVIKMVWAWVKNKIKFTNAWQFESVRRGFIAGDLHEFAVLYSASSS
jgi:hypothetical protein